MPVTNSMLDGVPGETRGEQQAFFMRQARAARALGMDVREFRENFGMVDFVPRDVDMDPPRVQDTITVLRNEIETKGMNPILKRVGLFVFDRVFDEKTAKGIQKWADVIYYWRSFADLFKDKGKRIMGRKLRPPGPRRRRLAPDPRDNPGSNNFYGMSYQKRLRASSHPQDPYEQQYQQESIIRSFVRESLEEDECKSCGFPSRSCPVCEISRPMTSDGFEWTGLGCDVCGFGTVDSDEIAQFNPQKPCPQCGTTMAESKKKKKKRKKTGIGWGNPSGPGVSDPGNIASPGQ